MSDRELRTWNALVLAGLLAFPNLSFSATATTRREQARAAYDRAVHMREALESQPENTRGMKDYEKVIEAFRAVYRASPAYAKTPVALAAVAELYEEMGRRFSNEHYSYASVGAYQFLLSQYPQNPLSRAALFNIGEIYRTDLQNAEEARKAFRKLLEQFPKSAKASEAQEKLKDIDLELAGPLPGPIAPALTGESGRRNYIPEVTAIRRWVGSNYSRIVISVQDEVKFDASRIANPDRIVFDLSNTRLSPGLAKKNFPVEDGFLRQIRVAQFRPTVTRVVLDVEKLEDYSVFSLPNPFRLVVDIHGAPIPTDEKPLHPKPPGPLPTLSPAAESNRRDQGNSAPLDAPGSRSRTRGPATPPPIPVVETPDRGAVVKGTVAGKRQPSEPEIEAKNTASVGSSSPPSTITNPAAAASRERALPIVPAAPTESGSRTLTRALGLKIGRIVIDPGHGGHDTGTIGPGGMREKDLVLDVALRIKKLIERNRGNEVILTRSDDTFIPLEERTAIANAKAADIFISIHANASRDRSARGIETYYLNFTSSPEALEVAARENATSQESVHQLEDLIKKIAMTEKVEESHEFAKQIQREVYTRLAKAGGPQRDRGVKKAPFVVLIGANMPSVLAEISFLTNPRDERLLKRPDHRQKIAEALYQGIARYVDTFGGESLAQRAAAHQSSPLDDPKF